MAKMQPNNVEVKTTVPDGGYGWVIVLALAINYMMVVPQVQNFGLIFKSTFPLYRFSATETAFVINLNLAFGMLTGLFNGLVLKRYGYRKTAVLGSTLVTIGITLTAFGTTFLHYVITYGIISSFGMGLTISAHNMALASYFVKKRVRAMSIAMTITGLGPILMPQLINILIDVYSSQGATLILGAISAHTLVSASLMQPLKWHIKKEIIPIERNPNGKEQLEKLLDVQKNEDNCTTNNVPEEGVLKRFMGNLHRMLDMDLFKDYVYLNIMFGMSLAMFAEINFSALTSFILDDMGLSTEQIAMFMSVLGVADIIFRFLTPYLSNYFKKASRPMYGFSLILLIITRFTLLLFDDYEHLLVVAAGLGVAKGVRTVYMSLVIPDYVPIEKLPNASGIQMMFNGIFVLIGGAILGVVRDTLGSYRPCILIINCVTLSTVIMWSVEYVIVKWIKRKHKRQMHCVNTSI